MPKIAVTKEQLEGPSQLDAGGMYEFTVVKFDPKISKDGKSVNLRPQLRVINHATQNGKSPGLINLNSQAGWEMKDLCHSLGLTMAGADGTELPGEFNGPDNNPQAWHYAGPIVGKTGKCEVAMVESYKDKTKQVSAIKRFFCQVPGCTEAHRESLL